MQPGDIIGFSGTSAVSDVINLGTWGIPRWSISHVGILAEFDGRQLLVESTTLDPLPCEILHKKFDGVQAHVLADVLAKYEGRVWQYGLYRPLYDFERNRLSVFLGGLIGTPYDASAAFRSADVGLSWFESLLRDQDLHSIFCSELVVAALSDIGIMPSVSPQRWSPNKLCRFLRHHEIVCRPLRLK